MKAKDLVTGEKTIVLKNAGSRYNVEVEDFIEGNTLPIFLLIFTEGNILPTFSLVFTKFRTRDSYSIPRGSRKLVLGESMLLASGMCLHWRCLIGKCQLPSILRRKRELTKPGSSSSDCLASNPRAIEGSRLH